MIELLQLDFIHKDMKQLICPVSDEKINEQITRLNALIGILLLLAGFTFESVFVLVFLTADFYIRAFTKIKFSPLSYVSHWLSNALKLGNKTIDKAPKIFAARLGFLMSVGIVVLYLAGLHTAATIVAGILAFFAALEFAFAICVGCLIYTYTILPFNK